MKEPCHEIVDLISYILVIKRKLLYLPVMIELKVTANTATTFFTPVTEPLSITSTKIHNIMDISKYYPRYYES